MGTALWSVSKSGYTNQNVAGRYVDGGATTTSTTGTDLDNGAAGGGTDITANKGDILTIVMDEAARVMFGGETATQTAGHIIPADIPVNLEVSGSGKISVCDIA